MSITVHVELKFPSEPGELVLEGRMNFIKVYDELPWPRLPVVGDTIYLNAGDIFTEEDVPVVKVNFHPTNGNVVIELATEEIVDSLESTLPYLAELTILGFEETSDPYAAYSADSPSGVNL